jgi:hypothetical protein
MLLGAESKKNFHLTTYGRKYNLSPNLSPYIQATWSYDGQKFQLINTETARVVAKSLSAKYSRYADDMIFSFTTEFNRIEADKVLSEVGRSAKPGGLAC